MGSQNFSTDQSKPNTISIFSKTLEIKAVKKMKLVTFFMLLFFVITFDDVQSGKFEKLKKRLKALEKKFSLMENQMSSFENQVSLVEGQVSTVEYKVSSVKDDVS